MLKNHQYTQFADNDINPDLLFNEDYINENIYVGIKPIKNNNLPDNLITKPVIVNDSILTGIEEFLFVTYTKEDKSNILIPIDEEFIDNTIFTPGELFKRGEDRIYENTRIFPFENTPFCVLHSEQPYGAAALLNKDFLKEIASKYELDKLIIIPSSISEILIIKDKIAVDSFDKGRTKALLEIIKSVNSELSPSDVLYDKFYVIDIEKEKNLGMER